MRVIVCGSRNWGDSKMVGEVLADLAIRHPGLTVIQGGARGADRFAKWACMKWGIECEEFLAEWEHHGKAAGPIRNQMMLDSGCDEVHAFKDEFDYMMKRGGTEHMVRIAQAAGVPWTVHHHD